MLVNKIELELKQHRQLVGAKSPHFYIVFIVPEAWLAFDKHGM